MIPAVFGAITGSLFILAAVLLAVGAALAAGAVWLMARALLRPPRMTDGKALWVLKRLSPADLGLPSEDVSFDVRDERSGEPLRVAGWWIAARGGASDRTVVLIHGYADAKVGAIAWAPVWRDLGFNVLAIDLRAHGESGGTESTAGYFERHDVIQVLGQLRAERPACTRQVVLFGVSLGATVAVATAGAAAEDEDATAEAHAGEEGAAGPVAAIVLESPFADFRTAAMFNMDAMGVPGRAFQRAALRLAGWMSGARFDDMRLDQRLKDVRCPVLMIAPEEDGFSTPAEAAAMEEAVLSRPAGQSFGRVWKVPGADHLLAVRSDPERYRQRLQAFLEEALDAADARGPRGCCASSRNE